MRITITEDEYQKIQSVLVGYDFEMYERLSEESFKFYRSITSKKKNATKNANKVKIEKSKLSITNAINIL